MKIIIIIIKAFIVALLMIILVFVILIVLDKTLLKPTPESELKSSFNINLKNFKYSVETFEKQRCFNGDGHTLVIYKFDNLSQENINYLKSFNVLPLPVSEEDKRLMDFNLIPEEFFEAESGFYIYEPLDIDYRGNYQVFIIDTEKGIAVLYYQYM